MRALASSRSLLRAAASIDQVGRSSMNVWTTFSGCGCAGSEISHVNTTVNKSAVVVGVISALHFTRRPEAPSNSPPLSSFVMSGWVATSERANARSSLVFANRPATA